MYDRNIMRAELTRDEGGKSVWKWLIATLLAFAAAVAAFWGHK